MSKILSSETWERLRSSGARTVALQFPEGLKRWAPETAAALKEAGYAVIISGDPCYGACDLATDALALADILIHFGHAPVEDRPGVIYEYVRFDFDPEVAERAISLLDMDQPVGLVTTVQHAHLTDAVAAVLEGRGFTIVVGEGNARTPCRGQVLGCSYATARAAGTSQFLYIGTGVFHAIGVGLATGARVVALDPYTGTAEEVDSSRLLRRRFAQIEKARQAKTLGIILSTKTGQRRESLARHLASLSPVADIICMQEVSPDSLLNLGYECYVNTACPRLAYDDQVRFPVPVLSPPEYEIVRGIRDWDDYIIDEI
ncbi:diphthamide biosynthesis enzyme Dph2 [Methanogenium sp. MK-MG]|uniref:diphthamide biosynthesis enzyme Dph2 n=1 Tax=Methanogenium sp. MK-MG TaxID=2599926 RepID=UPI0013ED29D4|nr:diphthamide biosynthesis enzyme Dph2 [Methanogenium sp. MK-MG]KAF1073495.1 2-(3-amino-3-carboxypropyl)histidine synthase [Methanogenium sp. MK-MG]